jgi:hypothetical protein
MSLNGLEGHTYVAFTAVGREENGTSGGAPILDEGALG